MRHYNTTVCTPDVEPPISHVAVGAQEAQRLDTRCRIHVRSFRKRLADPDGISAKAAIDGLVRAGLLKDDSAKFIREVTYSQEKVGKDEEEKTILEIIYNG